MQHHLLSPLLLAIQFLTRIPVPRLTDFSDQDLGRSVLWYPAVGIVIGLILIVFRWLMMDTDPAVQAALLLTVWVLLTGALHLDGLADSADAWLGGHGDKEKTLKLMHDPTSGPAALVVVFLVMIIKFAGLMALAQTYPMWTALLVVPMLGRAAVVALFLTTPYARKDGIGARHAEHLPHKVAGLVLLAAAFLALLFLGFKAIWVLLATAAVWAFLRYLMIHRLEGTTGDTSGAMIEIIEAVALASLVWAMS